MQGNNVSVDIDHTTAQINSMLNGIKERDAYIASLKKKQEALKEPWTEYNELDSKAKELKKQNQEARKLIELLVGYAKDNYNKNFDPGDLFHQKDREDVEEVE